MQIEVNKRKKERVQGREKQFSCLEAYENTLNVKNLNQISHRLYTSCFFNFFLSFILRRVNGIKKTLKLWKYIS